MKWLARDLITGPYLGLVTSEAGFARAMKHLKVPLDERPTWVSDGADATTHTMTSPNGHMACIVAIRAPKDVTGVQVAAMLVHEAVHVWQHWRASIGEREPSREFEAYSIQALSQRLMQAFAESRA